MVPLDAQSSANPRAVALLVQRPTALAAWPACHPPDFPRIKQPAVQATITQTTTQTLALYDLRDCFWFAHLQFHCTVLSYFR